MPSSAPIDGRATPFIETSRASKNSAPHSTSSVPHARPLNLPAVSSSGTDEGEDTGDLLEADDSVRDRSVPSLGLCHPTVKPATVAADR